MKTKLSVLAASLACMAAIAPTAARADAVAQSILDISSFTATLSGGGTVVANNPLNSIAQTASITGVGVVTTGTVPSSGDLTQAASQVVVSGAYTPLTQILGGATGQFASAFSNITGSALTAAGANAEQDSTVSLTSPAFGGGNTTSGLTANLDLTVGAGGSQVTFAFDAFPFLRTYLGQNQLTSLAQYSMNITISQGGTVVFSWSPDGENNLAGTGVFSESDTFDLNDSINKNTAGNNQRGGATSAFSVTSVALAEGNYDINISSSTFANAAFVPEPGMLFLLGIGALGAVAGTGMKRWRKDIAA